MTTYVLFLILPLILSGSHGVHWSVWEIKQHHKFFPSRLLQQENSTISYYMQAVEDLKQGVNYSLYKVIDFHERELQMAIRQTMGTHNEDCVKGLSTYMSKAVENAVFIYDDCIEEVLPRLTRLKRSLQFNEKEYNSLYQSTIANLDHCVSNYADNQDSQVLITNCVKSYRDRYFSEAKLIEQRYSTDSSPAMAQFRGPVVNCTTEAFDSVVKKGTDFLEKMKCCFNSTSHQYWRPVKNTLKEQIGVATERSKHQFLQVENEIRSLYDSRLLKAEKNVSSFKPNASIDHLMSSLLSTYFYTVNVTGVHNRGDLECVEHAKQELLDIAKQGENELFKCDANIRESITSIIDNITSRFEDLNSELPSIGNVAILNCFSEGYIFAPNTIRNCFELTHSNFNLTYTKNMHYINNDLKTLENVLQYYFNYIEYPLVKIIMQEQYLEGDKVLHNLQRCLYKSSATIYDVTTPGTPQVTSTELSVHETHEKPIYIYTYDEGV